MGFSQSTRYLFSCHPSCPQLPQKHFALMPEVSSVSINTIRTLCMDAVQQANSGHPGTPMAMAPVVYTLWQDISGLTRRPHLA